MNRWASWICLLLLVHCKAAPERAAVDSEAAPVDAPAAAPTPQSPPAIAAPLPLPASAPAAATEWLPLAVGNAWTLVDRAGTLEIRVARSEQFLGRDCFVVEWTSEGKTYQSEHWYTDSTGIWVAQRHVNQQALSL